MNQPPPPPNDADIDRPVGTPDALRPRPQDTVAEWARRVRAEREQVARLAELDTPDDFYAPVASVFRADPHRTDDPVLDILRGLTSPHETWLDVGAGGGRLALPLALLVKEVIAVEPSDGMLAVLREGMAEHSIKNVRIMQRRWPFEPLPQADVGLIANIGNDIEKIAPFLDALEVATSRLRIAVNWMRSPRAMIDDLWEPVHGEARIPLPALAELVTLIQSRGAQFELRLTSRSPISFGSSEEALSFARRQLWLREGSEKDISLQRILDAALTERDGRYGLSWEPVTVGVLTW